MSIADITSLSIESSSFGVVDRVFTAADLAALPEDLPSGRVYYELELGKLAIMSPPGESHSYVQLNIGFFLKQQGQGQGRGRAYTEIGIVISRNPDTVYGADVAFIGNDRLPVCRSKEGYLETIPNLVVEIRSKNNSMAELSRKARNYISAGVQTVWIVDETTCTITIEEANVPPRVVRENDPIPAPAAIPDFDLIVSRVFE
jgi:Uma2 family endonuclease